MNLSLQESHLKDHRFSFGWDTLFYNRWGKEERWNRTWANAQDTFPHESKVPLTRGEMWFAAAQLLGGHDKNTLTQATWGRKDLFDSKIQVKAYHRRASQDSRNMKQLVTLYPQSRAESHEFYACMLYIVSICMLVLSCSFSLPFRPGQDFPSQWTHLRKSLADAVIGTPNTENFSLRLWS